MDGAVDPAPAVLVTGASSGIGEACAFGLAERGWRVFAGVRRDEDGRRLEASHPGRIEALRLDVTDDAQVAAAAERIEEAQGSAGLAGLVNNAGVAVGGPLEHLPLEQFRHSLAVNVTGAVAVIQANLPALRRARGRIVNMSFFSGRMALPFIAPYAASKHALVALSDSLRVELAPWGMHVALIEPGNVRTPIWDKSLAGARELRAAMPARAERHYGPAMDALQDRVGQAQDITPEMVVERVWHALTARRPRARYPIGRNVRLLPWLDRMLPHGLRDQLILRALPRWGEEGGR